MFVDSIPVGLDGVDRPMYLVVEPDKPTLREWIRIKDVDAAGNKFSVLTRGLTGGTDNITHPANSIVRSITTKELVDDLFSDIEAAELVSALHATDGGDPHASAGYLRQSDTDPLYVGLNGDTMTGALVLNANPVVALGAATKQYVDGAVIDPSGTYLKLDGTDPMTGPLDMGTDKILNVVDGTDPQDAATASQVATVNTALTDHAADVNDPHSAAGYLKEVPADVLYLRRDGTSTMQGDLNMFASKIINVGNGTADADAVSKKQMDDAIAAALTSYDTATVSDSKNDVKMQSYYTKDDDPRAVAGRRIYIQSADPGAIANDDIWHDLP